MLHTRSVPARVVFGMRSTPSPYMPINDLMNDLALCSAYLARGSSAIGARTVAASVVTQAVGSQQHFTVFADAASAENEPAARAVDVQPPASDPYLAARAFEAKFEGWR